MKTISGLVLTLALACGDGSTLAPQEVVFATFEAIGVGDEDAINELVREDYIQHSALAADGRAGLLEAADTLASLTSEVHRVLVDGNLVAIHQTYGFPDGRRMVAFDVFRVEGEQLAEHWDALQIEVPASETVSGRSMTDGPTAPTDLDQTEANRTLVTQFVDVVLTQGQFDRITEFVSTEQYDQHNPQAGDGLEGISAFVAQLQEAELAFFYTRSPLVVAMGDFVLVGSEGVFGPAADEPFAVFYDLFRVADGRIVEHWDVIPDSPDPSTLPHENGFF